MKIAFLSDNIFSNGGVQRVVTTVSNLLCKDHEIDIICTNKALTIDRDKYGLSYENIKIIHEPITEDNKLSHLISKSIRAINRYTNLFNNKYMVGILAASYYSKNEKKQITKLINSNEYDVVIGCEGYYGILLGIIKEKINTKTIAWNHNSYDAYLENKYRYYWNRDIFFKKYISKLDQNIVLTESDKEKYFEKLGIKSKVIYNPLSFRCDKKSNLKSNKIVAAGRLCTQKGFDNLIKAFKLATVNKNEKWKLMIIGDGEDEEDLKNLVTQLNIDDKVEFIPFTKDIGIYLNEASIYAMSSRWEGFGLVVTEAMEAGLPIVSFDVSGPREILKGYNCSSIVESGDISQFSNALDELMNSYDKRKEYSLKGLERVKVFYGENIALIWNNLLTDLCNDFNNLT